MTGEDLADITARDLGTSDMANKQGAENESEKVYVDKTKPKEPKGASKTSSGEGRQYICSQFHKK